MHNTAFYTGVRYFFAFRFYPFEHSAEQMNVWEFSLNNQLRSSWIKLTVYMDYAIM